MLETSQDRSRFRRRLLSWFDKNQRDLPWRKRKTRYRIWVSEIMLQQTQVVTVIDYFNRFMKQFPNIRKLAGADEDEVLKLWEGLGYYRRARQLHAAAQVVVQQHGGRFPNSFPEVLALPGVGRYTAGAILSIADDVPLPIVEGNTIRVYSRLFDYGEVVTTSAGQKQLWEFAESLVSKKRPGDLNQALMELGSEVCTVKSPSCTACPVNSFCKSFQQGEPESLPNKGTRKTNYQDVLQVAVIVRRRDRIAVRLCGPDEHWAGLWDFPRFAIEQNGNDNQPSTSVSRKIVTQVKRQTGLTVSVSEPFHRMKHAVTRYRIKLDCYRAETVQGRLKNSPDLKWVPISELNQLAMSATGRKIAKLIDD